MGKEQIKLLERVKKYEYPEIEKEFLSQQEIPVQRLQCAFDYFYQNNPYFNHEELVQEVHRCFHLKPEKMTEKNFIIRCRYYLLPGYSKDTMFKSLKKQEMIASAANDWAKERLTVSLIKYEIPEERRSFLLSKCSQREDYTVAIVSCKHMISDINECQHTLDLLLKNENENYYNSSFECNKKLLEEYKTFLLTKIDNAEL